MPAAREAATVKDASVLVKIPVFPPIALRLLHLLSNENVAIAEMLEPLRADPAFSAEILRRANSAMFGFSSQISSLQHALVVLGLRRVRALSMTVATSIYLKQALQIEELRRCWRHTLATALLTEELAGACLMHVDLAYTAGLLHDVGRLGLLVAHPEEYSTFLRDAAARAAGPEPFDLLDYEKEVFGADHCEAGNWLAAQWKLPDEFAVVTGRHHDRPYGQGTGLLGLVFLGCQLADALGFSVVNTDRFMSFDEIRGTLPESARHRLADDSGALCELVESRIQALDIEGLNLPPGSARGTPPPQPRAETATPVAEAASAEVAEAATTALAGAAAALSEARAAPAETEPPAPEQVEPLQPRSSTLLRDLLAAIITCLVAGTGFFLLLRALAE